MSPLHRTRQRDFNDQFTEVVAQWQATSDALYHLQYDFVWDKSELEVQKALEVCRRFLLSARKSLQRAATLRANTDNRETE